MGVHRWILALASRLVPRASRAEWRAEWDAELRYRERTNGRWNGAGRTRRLDLIRRSSGAVWDALWLQSSRWYSLRLFGRHWRLAVTAVGSLSIAIAATALGLSAYNALLVRPPGVRDPATLRFIHIHSDSDPFGAASFPEFTTYRDQARAFSDIAAYPYAISSISFGAGDRKEQVVATQVSTNYFNVLGIAPQAGMLTFRASPANDVFDIVLGDRLWRILGADPGIIGRTVQLNDQPVTIVGIAPSTFSGMTWGFNPDVWMSLRTSEKIFGNAPTELTDRNNRSLHMVGRVRPGISDAQASADIQLIAAAIERDHADTNKGRSAVLTALTITPPGERGWMSMILGALILIVVLTLVVACTNVTNLLLGLASSRRHEMLVRAALGASRLQLVAPLVRESIVLGLASGVLGYGAAWITLAKLATFTPSLGAFLPTLSLDLRPDALVLVATMGIALLAGVAVGLAPALRGAADGLSGAINRELSAGEPRKARVRNVLVAIQMAIATVVLVGVGVSIRSLVGLQHVSLGFTARHLVYGGVDVKRSGYDERTGPAFYERIRERLRATPGVEAVTLASDGPMMGYSIDHVVADGEPPANGHGTETPYLVVDDQYFSAIGIGLLEGRTFDARDRAGRTEVAVVNATLARRQWPGREPLGQRLHLETGNRFVEVIGVVPDGKYGEIDEEQRPLMYLALAQHYLPLIAVVARTNGARDTVMRALSEMESRIVFGGPGAMTLDDMLGISMLLPKTIGWTTIVFGVLALLLAVFGLYSTVFYAVSLRRVEIGIRTTLGATPAHLFRMVLRQTGAVVCAGALTGLASGLALTPLASSIFYGIGSIEPWVIGAVAFAIAGIALLTTYAVVRPWTRLAALDLLRR